VGLFQVESEKKETAPVQPKAFDPYSEESRQKN
jgi:hypothetical protein